MAVAECPPAVEAWARECAASAGVDLTVRLCHADGFVVDVQAPDGSLLDVDVSHARPDAFRRVGELSIAPIGEFADWKLEPLSRQRSLDVVTECVRRAAPSLELGSPSSGPHRDGAVSAVGTVPWLLLALVAGALVRGLVRLRGPRIHRGLGAMLAGLSLATFTIRWGMLPHAFFHQNGQGPGWVDMAWRGAQRDYGPGYAEVYGWVASLRPAAPEGAIFLANACAGALIPVFAYALVRRASSSRLIAGAAAIAFAIAPIAARLAQSESYFAPILWLLFVASLALADAARFEVGSTEFVADVAIATFAISQAARIHPVAWLPAAVTPLVMVTGMPSLRVSARRAAAATAVVGLGVLLLTGRTIWEVVRGSLGHSWMPTAGHAAGETVARSLVWLAIAAAILARAWTRSAQAPRLAPLALLVIVVGIAVKGNLLASASAVVIAAYAALYAPAVTVIVATGAPPWLAGLLRRRALRERALALAVVTSGVLFAVTSARTTCTLPTDARELSWVLGWRGSLPRNALVSWYGHAGQRMLDMPLYRGAEMPRSMRLEESASPAVARGAYYVHTSLCATDEGRATCEAFEGSHRLVPVERSTLPAIGSLPYLPFAEGTLEVVLYRLGE
jgi:hypothetical protein